MVATKQVLISTDLHFNINRFSIVDSVIKIPYLLKYRIHVRYLIFSFFGATFGLENRTALHFGSVVVYFVFLFFLFVLGFGFGFFVFV